ncbi:hypothetical protein BP6252_07498 [Coleophoma cylindrospora]|uniref:glutathione transferase n=1 Tax=Coleophoma cylindrospora TaxID=1849047 RepID=A0A3D8RA90_9HELO|nr:hypothetical protein BP6252_07498 [Coleophoma cylindrospora]
MERPNNIPLEGLVLYVVKATATSTHNTVKPLILIEELEIPHQYYVVEKVSAPWFEKVNPHKMVPAIEDSVQGSDSRIQVWESTSTLTYLVDAYDTEGLFRGRTVAERTEVGNWLTLHTAALGATGKYWLYFEKLHPERIPKVTEKYVLAALIAAICITIKTLMFLRVVSRLRSNIQVQYDILEKRLSQPKQQYLALPDRPSIADIATLPFADEPCAALFGLDLANWPHILDWSKRMNSRPAVVKARERVAKMGHE